MKRYYPVTDSFPCPACGRVTKCVFTPWFALCRYAESSQPARRGGWIHPFTPYQARIARAEIRRQRRAYCLRQIERGVPPQQDTTDLLLAQVARLFARFNRGAYATRVTYRRIWQEFAGYLGARWGLESLLDIQPEHVALYLGTVSAASRNQVASAIAQILPMIPGATHITARQALGREAPVPRARRSSRLMPQARAVVRRLRGYAFSTRDRYATAWYRFVDWVEHNTQVQNLRNLRPKHLEGYLAARRAQGVSEEALGWEVNAIEAIHQQIEGRRWGRRLCDPLKSVSQPDLKEA